MRNKLSIRMRLTLLSALLLTICCIGLTTVLNLSATRMADVIQATTVSPAAEVGEAIEPVQQPMVGLVAPAPAQAARSKFQYESIVYMVFVILAGGGLTYYITGRALRPLKDLDSQMKNRTVHNLAEKLEIPESHDEIADLTLSFNQMSNKLDEAFSMQKRFSQSAAHELRTPLTVLKTKVDVFKKKTGRTPEEYDKLLEVITAQTDRLSDLVKELLDLSNMDALDCTEEIQLDVLLAQIAQELAPIAQQKKVRLSVSGGATQCMGNESLLHRAFYNLVENAIKYNTENGTVRLCVNREENRVVIRMEDSGIGIPTELHELIFEPFYRVDKSRSRQMGGAGLGLSTVKAIVEKHGGEISVATNQAGGSTFSVKL